MLGYNWLNLKRGLILGVKEAPLTGVLNAAQTLGLNLQDHRDELLRQIKQRIEGWDIRCAKDLIDKFPLYFPAELRNKTTINAWQNAAGVWFIN
jgi:hypothetical protein